MFPRQTKTRKNYHYANHQTIHISFVEWQFYLNISTRDLEMYTHRLLLEIYDQYLKRSLKQKNKSHASFVSRRVNVSFNAFLYKCFQRICAQYRHDWIIQTKQSMNNELNMWSIVLCDLQETDYCSNSRFTQVPVN